ncbi:two-component regulator propeller domain-containing protein [Arcticibacter sp.]|uniref:hybrid sensor histidine kinase/response regulator transcription factor n=1 Tax=Arcticibacter sp. TaxID=1872630 RepID=UPI00388F1B37
MKAWVFTVVFILIFCQVKAQAPFSHLNIEKGLSNNSVNAVYKDRYGFMWFGTDDGLNRYDGFSFNVFKSNIKDPQSLIHNRIVDLAEDRDGALWIGTNRGLSVFDHYTSRFSTPAFSYAGKKRRAIDPVYTVKADDKGSVFVGVQHKGLLVRKAGQELKQINFQDQNGKPLEYNVYAIAFRPGEAWLVTNMGLCVYTISTDRVRLVSRSVRRANRMIEKDNVLWIATDNGLFRYDVRSKNRGLLVREQAELSAPRVMDLRFQGEQLWIATDGGGVDVLHTKTAKVNRIASAPDGSALSSNAVMCIYSDDDNDRIWLGTLRGGVNLLDQKKNKFKTVSHLPNSQNSLISDFVLSFCEDTDGSIWVGTDGAGISVWNRKTNSFRNYTHRENQPSSISHNNITSIVRDDDDVIWVATFGGGINRYDRSSDSFTRFACMNNGQEDRNVWKLFKDSKNDIWAGTSFGSDATYKLNRKTQRFEPFDSRFKYVTSFGEDNQGNVWLGTEYGQLVQIDENSGKHRIYNLKNQIRSIICDKEGNLFVGVQYTGLVKFDHNNSGKFSVMTEAEGLCNNSVLNIQEDASGNLWMSTFNGLSKWDQKSNRFINFYEEDGLQSNQFSFNASLKLQSGEILFGGIRGFNIFSPEDVRREYNPSKVLIAGIRINNIPIQQDQSFETEASIYSIKELVLPYDKAVLSIDYTTPEYSGTDRILYKYILEGWDNIWNYSGKARTANYSQLWEGNYILRIKSTNEDGLWTDGETVLKIKVLPPWYRSWWAYVLYVAAVFSLIYFYINYHLRQSQLRYEIQSANLNTQKERELNEKKISFFTHIAHEFRTPLTLIMNPVKELLNSEGKKVNVDDMSGVFRNAKRLLSLVDQLLLFGKAEGEDDKLKVFSFNIHDLCHEVFLCFNSQASLKKIHYSFTCENKDLELYGDRQKVEIAVFNLVSNAFKYTSPGGSVSLTLTDQLDELLIEVSDTGRGVPEDVGNQIFERFYQVTNPEKGYRNGFGIGLYLVKKFISAHKGSVSYVSEKGKGSTFSITLLKGLSHFDHLDIRAVHERQSERSAVLEETAVDDQASDSLDTLEMTDIELQVSDRLSLLIVDDNTEIRNYIRKTFIQSYNVLEASDGLEGLRIAERYSPDIIISDISMPRMTGIELCQKIKESAALNHIPVVLLTSATSDEVKLKGLETGAADYITKPFEREMLVARVVNLLKSRNNLQQYFYNHITLQSDNLKISPEYREFLNRCISVIETHLQDPSFSARRFADELGMSHSNLYKRVKSVSGKSVSEFIRYVRLRKAAELMINSDCNVSQASFEAGFNDIKYFREQFTKLFGMKPSEYIKKYRKSFHESYKLNKMSIEVQES